MMRSIDCKNGRVHTASQQSYIAKCYLKAKMMIFVHYLSFIRRFEASTVVERTNCLA